MINKDRQQTPRVERESGAFVDGSTSLKTGKGINIKWQLLLYDIIILLLAEILLFFLYRDASGISLWGIAIQAALSFVCIFSARIIGRVYQQIWRYGGIQCYIRLLLIDGLAFVATWLLETFLPIEHVAFPRMLGISCLNLLGALAIRMMYRYAYKCGNGDTTLGRFLNALLRVFAGMIPSKEREEEIKQINIAIIGAGRTGVSLAGELKANRTSAYAPKCFVDIDPEKVGRNIHGIPVLPADDTLFGRLRDYQVREVVLTVSDMDELTKKRTYERYIKAGYRVKVYDYPMMPAAGAKRHLREFDIEELLFRDPVVMQDEKTDAYYRDKIILITGGGGSIGSELCRQLAKMEPCRIIILDIYENGAYDVQQELKIAYGNALDVKVEIVSINNRRGMIRVFKTYHPQIVINAAAHKHVPLMENNCIEAVENNVFGTKILVDLCEEFGADRFMMVSTDKAVNPTNVMGATKRMCEMIVQSASTYGKVKYSATRFGNVLGSAGSVIPLFKRQIASGGPITITDKRIIRYFMTIPEAAQLVLQSGAMAKNGELFVLDMGQPVRILDLAENMIRLSGAPDIEIIETGLRPGEKLYEELLVKTEALDKTDNHLIFIEKDTPHSKTTIDNKLAILRAACDTEDDCAARNALKQVVETYKTPEEVNANATASEEMKNQRELATL